ncbi:MAG TPA: DUF349 domain-containing protein [Nitrococcus sp.]|nr:DUF349 domain-containing protein [Nitrococcus sp.]
MWFDRFRRPRWQHRNPKIRQEAVASLSTADSDEYAALALLAVEDPAPTVRETAVKRLATLETLCQRAQEDTDATVRDAARIRYCQLLAEGCDTLDEMTRITAVQACQDASVLAWVARSGREEAIRVAALERLDDSAVLEEVINNDPVARVRRIALERISDEAVLERLANLAQRTGRKIARRARERLDDLRRQHHLLEAAARERLEVVAALEALAEQPRSLNVGAERQRLLNRWEAQGQAPTAELQQRLMAALEALDNMPPPAPDDEPPTLLEDVSAADTAVQMAPVESLERAFDEVIASREPSPEAVAQVQRLLAEVEPTAAQKSALPVRARTWLNAARRYLTAHAALESELACEARITHPAAVLALERQIAWPQDFPVPALLQEARRLITCHENDQQNRRQHARKEQLEKLQRQLDEIEAVLGEGHLRAARRLLQRAEHLAQGIEGALPGPIERRLRYAVTQIAELRDWRRFAVLPKQEALCRAMEALTESAELSAPERARRVHDLQSQWKATGGSDSTQSRALWERFSRAADRAFEPCRAWFEAEAQRRRSNFAERERICNQLAEFVERADWDSITASALEQIRYTAREEWRHFGPVDREQLGVLRPRFEAFMETLTQHIEAKRAVHRAGKAELVDKARALLEHADPEVAAEQAKRLQQEWKALGSARPAADRALWKAFRSACDGIFARRDAQRDRRRSRRDQVLEEAGAICTQFEALIGERGPANMDTLRREADRLRAAFRSLSLSHGRDSRAMNERFEVANNALAKRLQQLESVTVRRELAELKRLAELTRAWEIGIGEPLSQADAGELPKSLTEPLQQRWTAAASGAPKTPDPEESRRICIRLEILASIDSPPADEALRMELQVKRLAEGMGSGRQPLPREEAQRWIAQWYGLPADEALQRRVDAALERLF